MAVTRGDEFDKINSGARSDKENLENSPKEGKCDLDALLGAPSSRNTQVQVYT